MNAISLVMAVFSLLAAADRIFGNKLGLGREFEKGFELFGGLALSMIGMIAVSPLIAGALEPALGFFSDVLKIDPSIIPATLFANDMGGAPLATGVAVNPEIGRFNALVVSSMMGATISFTIPCALGAVREDRRRELLLGLLCGIVTIPVGSFLGGLVLGVQPGALLWNILPLALFSGVIAAGLILCPELCVKIFGVFGAFIRIVVTAGLGLAVFGFLTGKQLIPGLGTLEEGAAICLNACAVMTGAFPLLKVLSRILAKPMRRMGEMLGVNDASVMGFVSSLANSITTFEMMDSMDRRGAMLNAAFAVSAAFVLADHLAFTLAFDPGCLPAVTVGKLSAGLLAVLLAAFLSRKDAKGGN